VNNNMGNCERVRVTEVSTVSRPDATSVLQEPVHSARILTLQGKETKPLVSSAPPVGPVSPSPSLLIERFDLPPTEWQTHSHLDQVVAIYFTQSKLHHANDGKEVTELTLGGGKTTICDRNGSESIRWTEAAGFLCVRIADSALSEAARSIAGCDTVELKAQPEVHDPRLANLLYALEAERQRGYSTGRLFVDCIERALGALLVSAHATTTPKLPAPKGGLPPHILRRILEWMHANLDRQVTLQELADCAGLSVSHFAHQFRRSVHASPHRYLLSLRIERSKTLLRNPKATILEVALDTGFETQQHFATIFRQMTGVSPGEYRRRF
jgi:AraC family transcriptional regulator